MEKQGRNGWFSRHKKALAMAFTAVIFGIALIGSVEYYTQVRYAGEVVYERLPSTILFSVIKLYAFSPTVSTGVPTPLCYEAAKWLAPLCTAYWLLRALEAVLRHRLELISRRLGKKNQILVVGYNPESAAFLVNLEEENQTKRREGGDEHLAVLVPDQVLEQEVRLELERERVLVRQPLKAEDAHKGEFAGGWLRDFKEAVLFGSNSPGNFVILKRVLDWAGSQNGASISGRGKIRLAVRCENRILRKVMEDYYDRFPGEKPLELRLFAMAQMAAEDLFAREPLYANCLDRGRAWLKDQQDKGNRPGAAAVLGQVPNPHLLIAGFGSLGQAVFEEALLTGALSFCSQVEGYERLRITIIDRDGEKCRELIQSRYPRIDKICQVEYIAASMDSIQVERGLRRLPPVTYGAVCFQDQTTAVEATEKLRWYLSLYGGLEDGNLKFPARIPIAVRLQSGGTVLRFLMEQEAKETESPCALLDFGGGKRILNRENVVGSRLEEEAKSFHLGYCKIQQMMERQMTEGAQAEEGASPGWDDDARERLWNGLNFEKRESNRAQAKNRPYMARLLELFEPLPPAEEMFRNVGNTDQFLKELKKRDVPDVLAAQEHLRWCNFHYVKGYVGRCRDRKDKGKVRRIQEDGEVYCGKVHNCLIDSWQEMREDSQARNTICYDVCALYGYRGQGDSGTEGKE